MATENIVTGKKFRICTDAVNKIYDRISFWTKASDVYNNSDKALETTCGSITGITSSLTSTSTTMAASASAIKQLNDKIADLNSNLGSNFDGILHCTSGNASTFYYVNDNMGTSYSYQSAGSNLNCVDFTIKYINPSWTLTALKKIKYSDNKNMENSQILNEGETLQWGYTEKKHYYIKIME